MRGEQPTCVYGCISSTRDSLGAQHHMSLATLRMALFYGCHYVHQDLVLGQNDISSYNNLRRAQNHFRAGMDCPQVVHKTIYGVNGNTTFVGSAAYVDLLTDFANGLRNETQRCLLTGSTRRSRTAGVLFSNISLDEQSLELSTRYMAAWAWIFRSLRNVTTPWFDRQMADASVVRVAVHVRRGDLSTYAHWHSLGRWVPDAYYERWLPRIAAAMWRGGSGVRSEWHIMSESLPGRSSLWESLQKIWNAQLMEAGASSVHWHIEDSDSDFLTTIDHMIAADVLLLAPSAYSTIAATYSLGVLVSVPFAKTLGQPPTVPYSDLLPAGLCLRSVHVLPAPPACSCLVNRTLYMMSDGYRRYLEGRAKTKTTPWYKSAVDAIGDSWKAPASFSEIHQCYLYCRSKPTINNLEPVSSPPLDEGNCAALNRKPPFVPFDNTTFSAEVDVHISWKTVMASKSSTRWASAWQIMSERAYH